MVIFQPQTQDMLIILMFLMFLTPHPAYNTSRLRRARTISNIWDLCVSMFRGLGGGDQYSTDQMCTKLKAVAMVT